MKMRKRGMALLLLVCMLMTMVPFTASAATGSWNSSTNTFTVTMSVGETITLKEAEYGQNFWWFASWRMEDPNIATVDTSDKSNYTITGVSPGTTTLVESDSTGDYRHTIIVVGNSAPEPVTTTVTASNGTATADQAWADVAAGSTLNFGTTTTVKIGETAALSASADGFTATWSIDSATVATVVATSGVITPVSAGTATVTAALTSGTDTIYVKFPIEVQKVDGLTVSASADGEALTMNTSHVTAPVTLNYVGGAERETKQLAVSAQKGSQVYNVINWASAMDAIASVDAQGLVTAAGIGDTTVTATLVNPNNAEDTFTVSFPIVVTVPNLVVKVSYNDVTNQVITEPYVVDSEIVLPLDTTDADEETVQLGASVTRGSKVYDLTWASQNENIATVGQNGLVTGKGSGSCEIYASFTDEYGTVHTITFTVSSRAAGVRAYFYLWASDNPEANYGDNTLGVWTPFGRGDLNAAYISSAEEDTTTALTKEFQLPLLSSGERLPIEDMILWVSPDFAPLPADENLYEEATENPATVTTDFPTIKLGDVTYYYEKDPNRKTGIGYSIYEYNVEWVRIKKEGGANATGYDNWVGYGSYAAPNLTWHVDGRASLVTPITFRYNVIEPNASSFTERTDLSFKTSEDTLISTLYSTNKKFTPLQDKTMGGLEYIFKGWYYDEACTIPVTSEQMTALEKDQDLDNTKTINLYGKYVAAPKTVTFVFLSGDGATVTKSYNCLENSEIQLPYGPDDTAEGQYFAGWSYRDENGVHTAHGNSETVAWMPDTPGGDVMTISAVYYTDTVGTYVQPESALPDEDYALVDTNESEADKGQISLPLFGTPVMKEVNGKNLLIVEFKQDFTRIEAEADDNSDNDTGSSVIAKNYEFDFVGFVLSTNNNLIHDEEEDLVARTPTVQGGYDFTKSDDVFYKTVNGVTFASLGLDTNGRYGYYIVIQLGANVGWATPYAIDTDGAYHYGTPWTIY